MTTTKKSGRPPMFEGRPVERLSVTIPAATKQNLMQYASSEQMSVSQAAAAVIDYYFIAGA